MNPYHGLRTDDPATFQLGIILSLGPGRWVVPPCADKVKNSFITLVWWSGLVACQSLSGQGAELHQETIRYLTQSLTSSLSLSSLSDFEMVLSLALSHSRAFSRPHARTLAHTHARTHALKSITFATSWVYGKIAKRMPKFTSQQNLKPPGGMLSLAWNSNCPSTSVGAKSSSPLSPCAQTNSRSNDFIRMDKPRAAQKQCKLRQSVIRNWVTPAPR